MEKKIRAKTGGGKVQKKATPEGSKKTQFAPGNKLGGNKPYTIKKFLADYKKEHPEGIASAKDAIAITGMLLSLPANVVREIAEHGKLGHSGIDQHSLLTARLAQALLGKNFPQFYFDWLNRSMGRPTDMKEPLEDWAKMSQDEKLALLRASMLSLFKGIVTGDEAVLLDAKNQNTA